LDREDPPDAHVDGGELLGGEELVFDRCSVELSGI
jgi:hypothetical protein